MTRQANIDEWLPRFAFATVLLQEQYRFPFCFDAGAAGVTDEALEKIVRCLVALEKFHRSSKRAFAFQQLKLQQNAIHSCLVDKVGGGVGGRVLGVGCPNFGRSVLGCIQADVCN